MSKRRNTGPELLREYLRSESMSITAFAASINVSTRTVDRWLSGKGPNWLETKGIEVVTAGKVPAHTWWAEEGKKEKRR